MGFLNFDGQPLEWSQIVPHIPYIKEHGIIQFINNYERLMKRPGDILKWGDEVEYMVVKFDHKNKKVQLSLRGEEILEKLQEKENNQVPNLTSLWRPEYARYMVEGTPGVPYLGSMAQFNAVEANMKMRRKEIQDLLHPDEQVMTITAFPRTGCLDFTYPPKKINSADDNPVSRSLFFPDEAISSHPRFQYMTSNIRRRRGEKMKVNVPIFRDTKTPSPFIKKFNDKEADNAAKPDHIYMDCMGFGFGNCCLQVTFQAFDIEEAKLLYDQLAPVCPIMLALTAASPIFKGYLSDIETRWQVISGSVDDRTRAERGLEPYQHNRMVISKSRCASISSYLSTNSKILNDINVEINEKAKQDLLEAGIDEVLAEHIAHLWIKDPVIVFSNRLNVDDATQSDHFENIQSTNWQSMRFKPPPPGSSIGWRVEFRVCETQITDFENAAFCVFIVLLTRVILTYKLDFLMPISYVDINMKNAQKRNAVLEEMFYFRRNVMERDYSSVKLAPGTPHCVSTSSNCNWGEQSTSTNRNEEVHAATCQPLTIDTIINGKEEVFPGFIPLIRQYLDNVEVGVQTRCSINEYLNFISKRASGEYMTTAQWIRHFVRSHPAYKQDSVVSDEIAYDLLVRCDKIEKGESPCDQLFGKTRHKSEYIIGLLPT